MLPQTHLGVTEIMNFSQINTFMTEKGLQVYQSKQNKYRDILVTHYGYKNLQA